MLVFEEREKQRVTRGKTSQCRIENQQTIVNSAPFTEDNTLTNETQS